MVDLDVKLYIWGQSQRRQSKTNWLGLVTKKQILAIKSSINKTVLVYSLSLHQLAHLI